MNLVYQLQRLGTVAVSCLILCLFSSCGGPSSTGKQDSPPPIITELGFQAITLDNLDAFQATDGNWELAGAAYTDRTVDKAPVQAEAGTGVLVNNNTESKRSHLVTQQEYGDQEVELEFMMAKGSNSGVYLQGRYEVQLFDSWGKEDPKHSDCGGIYQRWDESRPEGQKGYEGHAPLLNASRAPGLWQHLRIRFQAPRFDAQGNKTANARMLTVHLNGMELHRDVELTGPTRSAMFEDEQATGPLMIQGDHGPLAIRNVGIKEYSDKKVSLSGMTYQIFDLESNPTEVDYIPDFTGLTASEKGTSDSLSRNLTEKRRNYAMLVEGTIDIPESGEYLFSTHIQGGIKLMIQGKEALNFDGEHEYVGESGYDLIEVTAGKHPFQLQYRKQHRAWKNGLALYVEGPGIAKMPLHAEGSPMKLPDFKPLAIQVEEQEASAIRGYVMHNGAKRTHTISVGTPEGVHYNYDITQAALLNVWSGAFLDVRQMWVGRGVEQLAVPLGPSLELSGKPGFAQLANQQAPWPDSVDRSDPIQSDGYELNDKGEAVFVFHIGEATIRDHLSPASSERELTRSITVEGKLPSNVWMLLASGTDITKLPNGTYGINDLSYYLETSNGAKATLRDNGGQKELLLSLSDNSSINYSLIW